MEKDCTREVNWTARLQPQYVSGTKSKLLQLGFSSKHKLALSLFFETLCLLDHVGECVGQNHIADISPEFECTAVKQHRASKAKKYKCAPGLAHCSFTHIHIVVLAEHQVPPHKLNQSLD